MNQILETALRSYVSPSRDDWNTLLASSSLSYNGTPHSSTGFPPSFLLYGFYPNSNLSYLHSAPESVARPSIQSSDVPDERSTDPGAKLSIIESDKAAQFLQEFETHRSLARQALQFAQAAQQKSYNDGRILVEYEVGDLVLINPHSLNLLRSEKGRGTKLLMKFDGPFEILEKLGPATYRLRMPASYGIHPILNIAHLEKYTVSDPFFGSRPSKSLQRADFETLPEFEVEAIIAERWRKSKKGRWVQEFLTRFVGYDANFDEWLTRRQLRNAPDILRDWDPRKLPRSRQGDVPRDSSIEEIALKH